MEKVRILRNPFRYGMVWYGTEILGLNFNSYERMVRVVSPSTHRSMHVGLIRARLRAVHAVRAPVLIFLDSHIEVNKDWLQPVLTRIVEVGGSVYGRYSR